MAAKVIHFGPDDCHRLMVLRSAGYSIDDCRSLIQLRDCLAASSKAEALLMSDAADATPEEVIALARTNASLPVVLFRTTNLTYEEFGVDLVVHCLTPPEEWLNQVDSLIEKSRLVRTGFKPPARNGVKPVREPALAVAKPDAQDRLPGAERIQAKGRVR